MPQESLPAVLGLDAWNRCWSQLGANPLPSDDHARILASYREPHRAYHTLQHLEECLALRSRLDAPCDAPAEIDLALWFHDAVYQPSRDDNEARSATWLDDVATRCGVEQGTRERLHRLVMATCHRAAPQTRDEALLVDVDLAILGAPAERFGEYEAQVRREYAWVPEWLYRRKRREILVEFMDRPVIYSTEACRQLFEAQARRNLAHSIAALA